MPEVSLLLDAGIGSNDGQYVHVIYVSLILLSRIVVGLILQIEAAAQLLLVLDDLVLPEVGVQPQKVLRSKQLILLILILYLLIDIVYRIDLVRRLQVHLNHVQVLLVKRVPEVLGRIRIIQLQLKLHIVLRWLLVHLPLDNQLAGGHLNHAFLVFLHQ